MTAPLFGTSLPTFESLSTAAFSPGARPLAMSSWMSTASMSHSSVSLPESIQMVGGRATLISPNITKSFEERVFDCLVALKVETSQYAMHLEGAERGRLFQELDLLLGEDSWHEEDTLPKKASFKLFLKWSIYAQSFTWSSLGVSNAGTLLAAWVSERAILTADFENEDNVRWTAKIKKEDESGWNYAAGSSELKLFTRQTDFYFKEAAR